MHARLVVAPTIEPISIEQARMQVRADGDELDAQLLLGMSAVRQACERRTGRALITQTWELVGEAFGCRRDIELPRGPVQSVVSVQYTDPDGQVQILAEDAYAADLDAVPAVLVPGYGLTWPETRGMPGSVRIRLVCGYGATADSVPAELKQWMLLMLGHWMRNAEAASSDSLAPLPYIDSLIDPFVIWRFS